MIFWRVFFFIGCFLFYAPVGEASTLAEIQADFSVGFQQDGVNVPISDHQVILKKKSFTIVVYFKNQDSVLVNASFAADSFEQAKIGKPFAEIEGFKDLGMAEEAFNPKALLMMSAQAPHFWYYDHQANHRFNDVMRTKDIFSCHRIIAQIMYRDTTREMISIKDLTENALYLVFMKTEWTPNFREQIEKQREYIKVIFQ